MDYFDLLRELDDNKYEINDFIDSNNKTILTEEINAYTTFINQLLGHFNQLIVKVQDIISKEELDRNTKLQKEITEDITKIDNTTDSLDKLDSLKEIITKLKKYYKDLEDESLSFLKDDSSILEYNNLIKKANQNITDLKSLELPISIIEELKPYYEALKGKDIDKLNAFINKTNSILLNNTSNVNTKKGTVTERVFSLFAKINDQIVNSSFLNKNNLTYALYTLEDGSSYYAIIKSLDEIKILDQSFSNLPNLILTKDNIINTCKIIIKNGGIYYDLNEYMRYIEKSYKTKMTKDIDELILKYKNRLTTMENVLTSQLVFIDDIALLVNNKPCSNYPNITYRDVPINEYFSTYKNETERLIIELLLNPSIKSEFNTKSILKTLYDEDTINSLLTSNYTSKEDSPIINTDEIIVTEDLDVSSNIKTNYEKIREYLNSRVLELELLTSSPKINVTITKDNNPLFKDINTVLDLNTAVVICDKVYKKGQGDYAIIDYLKTGNTLKFTSKYKARDLASNTNRNDYLKLLIENVIKRYIYLKSEGQDNIIINFLDNLLNKNITSNDLENAVLNDETVLSDAVNNFCYDFLDKLSLKYQKVEELCKGNNEIIKKINNFLQ